MTNIAALAPQTSVVSRTSGVSFDQPSFDDLTALLAAQKAAYRQDPLPSATSRKARLRRLEQALIRHQDTLCVAVAADFGGRSMSESRIGDVLAVVLNVKHAISHVKKWMKPRKRKVELLFALNSAWIEYQPKGVVGIIAPWNFPIMLALAPLVAAITAGNRAMIKMSEFCPKTTIAVRAMIADAFSVDEVCVLGGDVEVARRFSALPFDHLIFTGSTNVGRFVMRSAADHLTPVTLELGGKSPAIVSRSGSIADAARKIAHGKGFNCGQVCISPDYALVPREKLEEFIAETRAHFQRMHPDGSLCDADYTNIVTPHHADRIHRLIADAKAKGAEVIACEDGAKGQRVPLHLVLDVTDDMELMREEIFGPILPIVPYDTIEKAIDFIVDRQRPLALYWFGRDEAERRRVLAATHSGGVVLNDWGWHVMQNDLPFGGIGPSGMGSYHGVEGFQTLSHPKSVFRERLFFPIGLFHPPYGNLVQRLSVRLFLGPQNHR